MIRLYRFGAVDELVAILRQEGASEALIQNSLAALSNLTTNSNIRDKLCEDFDILLTASDLFEVYADSEKVLLDLIFFVRNCLRAQPSMGMITHDKLPKILPGIKALAN